MLRCVTGKVTCQRMKMKAFRSFDTSGDVKLLDTQRNISEYQNPQLRRCGNPKSRFDSYASVERDASVFFCPVDEGSRLLRYVGVCLQNCTALNLGKMSALLSLFTWELETALMESKFRQRFHESSLLKPAQGFINLSNHSGYCRHHQLQHTSYILATRVAFNCIVWDWE